MKTENLQDACDHFNRYMGKLREAHKDAVNSGNQFAEYALLAMIERSGELQNHVHRLRFAANQTQTTTKKGTK